LWDKLYDYRTEKSGSHFNKIKNDRSPNLHFATNERDTTRTNTRVTFGRCRWIWSSPVIMKTDVGNTVNAPAIKLVSKCLLLSSGSLHPWISTFILIRLLTYIYALSNNFAPFARIWYFIFVRRECPGSLPRSDFSAKCDRSLKKASLIVATSSLKLEYAEEFSENPQCQI
jgi:hypothetical protein